MAISAPSTARVRNANPCNSPLPLSWVQYGAPRLLCKLKVVEASCQREQSFGARQTSYRWRGTDVVSPTYLSGKLRYRLGCTTLAYYSSINTLSSTYPCIYWHACMTFQSHDGYRALTEVRAISHWILFQSTYCTRLWTSELLGRQSYGTVEPVHRSRCQVIGLTKVLG